MTLKKDIHAAITDLEGDMRKDLKKELTTLEAIPDSIGPGVSPRTRIVSAFGATLQAQSQAITKAEGRISDVETCSAVTKVALLSLLKEQRWLQEKVTDVESRSRRNNIRIYGVPEGSEGDSMIEFVERWLYGAPITRRYVSPNSTCS